MSEQVATRRAGYATRVSWLRWLPGAVLLVAGVGALFFGFGAISGDYFAIKHVRVICSNPGLAQEVSDHVRVPQGANTLLTPLDGIVRQALAVPRVYHVRVSRELPDTLALWVQERRPAAAVQGGDSYMLVDSTGVALNRCQQQPTKLPVLRGLRAELTAPGDRLDEEGQALLGECLDALRQSGLGQGLELDFSHPYEISCYAADGTQGKLGTTDNLCRKLIIFAATYRSLKAQGKNPQYIDLRIAQRPVWKPRGG